MRIRAVLVFATLLSAAAVGLAMTATGAPAQPPASQDRLGPPPGPPPGRMGPGGPGGRGGIDRDLFRLDLTPAQREQVKTLMDAQRQARETYRATLQDIDKQIRAAVESGEFDAAAVRALAEKEAAAMVELRVLAAKTDADIVKLLTPEQKQALTAGRNHQQPPPDGRRRGRSAAAQIKALGSRS